MSTPSLRERWGTSYALNTLNLEGSPTYAGCVWRLIYYSGRWPWHCMGAWAVCIIYFITCLTPFVSNVVCGIQRIAELGAEGTACRMNGVVSVISLFIYRYRYPQKPTVGSYICPHPLFRFSFVKGSYIYMYIPASWLGPFQDLKWQWTCDKEQRIITYSFRN